MKSSVRLGLIGVGLMGLMLAGVWPVGKRWRTTGI